MSGGTFTNAGTTIEFDGTGAQSISTTGAFNNLTINKSSGAVTAVTDVTVDGVLTFTSGNIVTGSQTVIIGPTGSVSHTSGHVVGNLQKPVPAGPTSLTFEVGDAINYAPVDVAFASVTSPGNLTARATGGEHPNIVTSDIDPKKDVNDYWTLDNGGTAFSTYDATFNFVPGAVDAGGDPSTFHAQKFDSPNWSTPTVGTRTPTSVQATGLTTFSDFAVGEIEIDTIFATAGAHGSISPSGAV